MLRAKRNENLIIVYSKHFLFFEWKIEEADLRRGNKLRSSDFNLGDAGEKNSFLEIAIDHSGTMRFFLDNPKPVGNGYYVLTVLNKNHSHIKNINASTDSFATVGSRVDLFGSYGTNGTLPSDSEYPITVTCTAKSSSNDFYPVSNVNYENRMSEISSDLMKILEQALNTDIELSTDGENIKAHKIILQARSPVFHKMFEHDSSEAAENTVVISDIGSATMKKLVNFLYSGRMEKCNSDEAMDLYYAADKYEVLSLREDCKVELLKNLDVNNACSLFTLANRHNDDDLKEGVVQFVSANFTTVVNTKSINEMRKDDIILLMRLCVPAMNKK